MKKFLFLTFFLTVFPQVHAQTLPITITVNAATTLTSFIPVSIFGNNTAYWISNTANTATQAQVQAAGNYFLRYPGGSSSDDYHWNGTGSYNSSDYWVPSSTTYSYGFVDDETYTGTSSGDPSLITDGDTATAWLSNVDTDFPNHQWAEFNLPATSTVSAVTIVWGTPYATSFQVQSWPDAGWPPPLISGLAESNWTTTSAGTVASTGGTQGVTFTAVSAEYFRILMTASSAGAGGAYFIAEATLYDGSTQVSVNTDNGTNQTQVEVSSTDPANSPNYTTNPPGSMDFQSFMTYVKSFSPNAIPLITVNLGTGTAQEAAAWVNYANKVENYGIHYWQIGNETEGDWETGGPLPSEDYVRRYIEYYTAMKAVDPTIIITGPVSGSFLDTSNMYDGNSYVQDFITRLHALGDDSYINAVDFHWYPNNAPYTNAQALASPSSLDAYSTDLNTWLTGVTNAATIPVLMSEYNVDPGDTNFQVQLGNGLFVADGLGHFITDFGGRGYCNLWDVLNGGSGDTSTTGGDLGYLNVNNDGYQYQPHASYWAMQMMSSDWAIAGDTNSHQLVSTTVNGAPASLFGAYCDYRPDGIFSMVVVNKNPTNPYNTWITGLPFAPVSTAKGWTFNSSNYVWETTTTPYHASTDTAPTTFTVTEVSSSFPVTFQPYSITVIHFTAPNTPTPTVTASRTPSSTSTVTSTATMTLTATLTLTPALSPTSTVTSLVTATPTPTPSLIPTLTPTPSLTVLGTATPTPGPVNVLYPNPLTGSQPFNLNYNVTSGLRGVKVKIFTLAFRKICEDDGLPSSLGPHSFSLNLPQAGLDIANGLYYVVLYFDNGGAETHQIFKLLVEK